MLDNIIKYLSPQWALKREMARFRLSMLDTIAPAYDGASGVKRGMKNWAPMALSPDREQTLERGALTARSRDLYRNDTLARSAINTANTNIVGSGLALKCSIDAKFLGMGDDEAEEWENRVEREFSLWCRPEGCDAEARLTFQEIQALALLSVLQSGDVFVALPFIRRINNPYQVKLQLIEADRVCNHHFAPDTDMLSGGVLTDKYGAPVEYHILNGHPGGFYPEYKWQIVPAFGRRSGRRNILHLMHVERPGQRRGMPFLTPVVESLRILKKYSEAEMLAALVASMFTVFVKTESGAALDAFTPDTDESTPADELKMGPAAIVDLGPGEDITMANPSRPNSQFDGFVLAVSRQVGAALEIPFELLTKHFTASYSASRAAMLEAWKFFKMRRAWMAGKLCQPAYEEWLTEAILAGRIDAPGFFDDPSIRAAYCKTQWIGPAQGQIDPVKETQAAKLRIETGLSTRSNETAAIGGDWEANYRQLVKERRMLAEGGLSGDSPSTVTVEPQTVDEEETQ